MVDPNDNKKQSGGREKLSLKPNLEAGFLKQPVSGRSFEVEIKKKKRGLNIEIPDKNQNTTGSIHKNFPSAAAGNLTDKEFQARVAALQNAIKEEKEEKAIVQAESLEEKEPVQAIAEETLPIEEEVVEEKKEEFGSAKPAILEVLQTEVLESNVVSDVTALANVAKKYASLEESDSAGKKKEKSVVKAKQPVFKKNVDNKKISKATLNRVLSTDFEERIRSEASFRRARKKLKNAEKERVVAKVVRDVNIPDVITVGELASRMAVQAAEVIKYLMKIGTLANVNQSLDGDTAEIICSEFGHISKRISESDVENELLNAPDAEDDLEVRAPIVAIMGHVDHGKTTLLDTIRKTNVAKREAGGITQHVSSYQILTKSKKKITFIDTPGHAAFSKIRSRGAVVTDIIVLVVAADDGVKESTIEAIHHAKRNNIPVIVAINKIDKPDINIDRVKAELMNYDIVLEDFGGDVLSIGISALKNINIDEFLETILLQAEILEFRANAKKKANGTILESRVDHGKGIIASVIVQDGTLRLGDVFVAGAAFGKIRTIYNDVGERCVSAGPSMPVEIVGFDSAPNPGDIFSVVDSEQKAKEIAEYRAKSQKLTGAKVAIKTIDQMINNQKAEMLVVNVVVNADVSGSLEAIVASIEAITHSEIMVVVVEKSVGIIRESDVDFAKNTGAIIIGFNVNITNAAKELAKMNKIRILNYSVIYHITEEIKQIMSGMLAPIVEENYIGTADVRKIFEISRYGTIAGCCVIDGIVRRSDAKIKVKRAGKYIFEGSIKSMRHEKDELKEAKQNHECGILVDGYNAFEVGDLIECFEIVLKKRFV